MPMEQTGKQNTGDKRIKKTRELLRKSLMKLLHEKSASEISIREITDLAGLNRSTFYLHYDNVDDMIEQLLNELREDYCKVIQKYPLEKMEPLQMNMLVDFISIYGSHPELTELIFSGKLACAFFDETEHNIMQASKKVIEQFQPRRATNYEYHFNFFSIGLKKTIVNWIQQGMKETPQELAQMMTLFFTPAEFTKDIT